MSSARRRAPNRAVHVHTIHAVRDQRRSAAGSQGTTSLGVVRHHDLVVIGTGSGNSIVDDRFADLDVAIVEHGVFGGTCINVGCIPTKMYVLPGRHRPAHPARGRTSASTPRWTRCAGATSATASSAASTRSRSTGTHYRARPQPRTSPSTTATRGSPGPKQLAVEVPDGQVELTADRIVIATGGRGRWIPEPVARRAVPHLGHDHAHRRRARAARDRRQRATSRRSSRTCSPRSAPRSR